jgi:phosphomannomutase
VSALVAPDAPRDIAVVHTALHGVGDDTVRRVFAAAGFPDPETVATQAVPDPDFPTVSFPNPEESGAIDAALAIAHEVHPDVVIANDPDADRCAAAVLDAGGWRMLRGDELGALLGAHVLERGVGPDAVFASSIVSSRLLAAMATAAGIRHEETLTGFKWISRVPGLVFGYEEAIGYCVAPEVVRDKDGVSAALLLTEMVAGLKAKGRASLTSSTPSRSGTACMRRTPSRSASPTSRRSHRSWSGCGRHHRPSSGQCGWPGSTTWPAATEVCRRRTGVRWFLADRSRVIVRPSGTSPSSRSTSRRSSRCRTVTIFPRHGRQRPSGSRLSGRRWSRSPTSDRLGHTAASSRRR